MNKQPELRKKTEEKFFSSFFELAKKKNIRQISVGELSRLAGYNRSTFYEYFVDMFDLIGKAEDRLLEQIYKQFHENSLSFQEIKDNKKIDVFRLIFSMLNEPIYCLLGPNGDPYFFSRLRNLILPKISKMIGLDTCSVYFDYIVTYFYSAVIGFLQHWHEQQENIPEEELFNLGYNLVTHGLFSVIENITNNGENLCSNVNKSNNEF